jgi:hypothetical protein
MPILLGTDRTPHECFIQTLGAGLRIRADDLRRAMASSCELSSGCPSGSERGSWSYEASASPRRTG